MRGNIPLALVEGVLDKSEQVVPEKVGKKAYPSRGSISGKMFPVRVIVDDAVEPAVVVTVCRTNQDPEVLQHAREGKL